MDVYELLIIVTLTLQWLLHQGHAMTSTSVGTTRWVCTDRDVNFALHSCHTHLAKVTTAILHASDANYTVACSHFEAYMICVEPNIRGCGHSKLMGRYQKKVLIYTSDPYNCTRPDTSGLKPSVIHQPSLRYTLHSQGALVFINETYKNNLPSDSEESGASSFPNIGFTGSPLRTLLFAWTCVLLSSNHML